MTIIATGYPFSRPNYRAALQKLGVTFIVPSVWPIKKGKAEYRTAAGESIVTTPALFHHSDYPVIGGLLKGCMPLFPIVLWRERRRHRIGLVFEAHEPTLLSTLYHGVCAKLFGIKRVVFSWENVPFDRKHTGLSGLLHQWILMANLVLSDGVVCGNAACREIFSRITTKPLALIPLAGLDPERFRPAIPASPHTGVSFLFAGAVDYRKGLHVLLPAFARVRERFPDAYLTVVGSGSYEAEVERMITDLGISVTRIPWADHDRLVALMAAADVFVYPSIAHGGWEEQFGYSMAEASLMELPVIATRSGSIAEVVRDGETGVLVEAGSVSQLSDAMMRLAADAELRRRLGRAGRGFITQTFSDDAIAERYRRFFKTIMP